MHTAVFVVGIVLILGIFWDAFETLVLPRRAAHHVRIAWVFYRATWGLYSAVARGIRSLRRREAYLGSYGPMSLLLLLSLWLAVLILGFAMLHWGAYSELEAKSQSRSFITDLYYSGTTFFTLGLGDVAAVSGTERIITVVEAGCGFVFLALVIGYLPVLFQLFLRREVTVTMLDARAGSPPTVAALLIRMAGEDEQASLRQILREWEQWAAELLEGHESFPVLAYFRSQHDDQSWVATLTVILDTCAVLMATDNAGPAAAQARLTFAMARHAAVDLFGVLGLRKRQALGKRVASAELAALRQRLADEGITLYVSAAEERQMKQLHAMYEPYVAGLSAYLLMPLPVFADSGHQDDWQTSPQEGMGARA